MPNLTLGSSASFAFAGLVCRQHLKLPRALGLTNEWRLLGKLTVSCGSVWDSRTRSSQRCDPQALVGKAIAPTRWLRLCEFLQGWDKPNVEDRTATIINDFAPRTFSPPFIL